MLRYKALKSMEEDIKATTDAEKLAEKLA